MRIFAALTNAEWDRRPQADELSAKCPAQRPHCALWIPILFTPGYSLLLDRMQVYLVASQGLLLRAGFDCTVCTPFEDPAPAMVSVAGYRAHGFSHYANGDEACEAAAPSYSGWPIRRVCTLPWMPSAVRSTLVRARSACRMGSIGRPDMRAVGFKPNNWWNGYPS